MDVQIINNIFKNPKVLSFAGCLGIGLFYLFLFTIWAFVFVFVIGHMSPRSINYVNYKISEYTVDNLISRHEYRAAINVLEYKLPKILRDDPHGIIYKQQLGDCYKVIGEYSKSERIYREIYECPIPKDNKISKIISEEERRSFESSFRFNILIDLFKLYDAMGDTRLLRSTYLDMQRYRSEFISFMNQYRDSIDTEKLDFLEKRVLNYGFNNLDAFDAYPRIRMSYAENPIVGIKEMCHYVDSLSTGLYVRGSYCLRMINKLIGWEFEQNRLAEAYKYIDLGIEVASRLYDRERYSEIGQLSDYCFIAHDYENGKRLLDDYWFYVQNYYNPKDLEYIRTQIRRLRFQEQEGEDVKSDIINLCSNIKEVISNNLVGMNQEQREFFVNETDLPFDYALELLVRKPSRDLAKLCFENQVFKKGLLLRSEISLHQALSNSSNTQLHELYNKMLNLQDSLTVIQNGMYIDFNGRAKSLEQQIAELDKQLSRSCSSYSDYNDKNGYKVDVIKKRLKDKELLIELIDNREDINSNKNLIALLCDNSGIVDFVNIGNSDELRELVERGPSEFYDVNNIKTANFFSSIVKRYKHENIRETKNTLYYSTSGLFNQISFASLPTMNGQTMADEFDIRYLSNLQNVHTVQSSNIIGKNTFACLWGGINYSNDGELYLNNKESLLRGTVRGDSLCYLTNSYDEVVDIGRILANNNIAYHLFANDNATKSSFIQRSMKGDVILHVSTHGFIADDVKHKWINPMYNSGLFFAGANKYWMKDSMSLNQNDGILRSYEIQRLNFSHCKLTVLSACNTGLGYNDCNEGVYGLQRAFKLAGVQTILMSLWSVDDYATSLLMLYFYENMINKHMEIHDAFFDARNKLRQQYKDPMYWGGFVLLD